MWITLIVLFVGSAFFSLPDAQPAIQPLFYLPVFCVPHITIVCCASDCIVGCVADCVVGCAFFNLPDAQPNAQPDAHIY